MILAQRANWRMLPGRPNGWAHSGTADSIHSLTVSAEEDRGNRRHHRSGYRHERRQDAHLRRLRPGVHLHGQRAGLLRRAWLHRAPPLRQLPRRPQGPARRLAAAAAYRGGSSYGGGSSSYGGGGSAAGAAATALLAARARCSRPPARPAGRRPRSRSARPPASRSTAAPASPSAGPEPMTERPAPRQRAALAAARPRARRAQARDRRVPPRGAAGDLRVRLGRQLGVARRADLGLEPPRDGGTAAARLAPRPARPQRKRPPASPAVVSIPATGSAPRLSSSTAPLDLGVGRLGELGRGHVLAGRREQQLGVASGSATLTSGSRPSCQIGRPSRVSQRSTPIRIDEPSVRSNRPSTVPVPNVFSPTTVPRSASWMAPVHDLRGARGVCRRRARPRSGCPWRGRPAGPRRPSSVAVAVDRLVHDPVADELARDADGLVDVAARVAAEVEDDRRRAGRLGVLDRALDRLGRAGRELLEPDHRDLACPGPSPTSRAAGRTRGG